MRKYSQCYLWVYQPARAIGMTEEESLSKGVKRLFAIDV